jgi:hypothetical protein
MLAEPVQVVADLGENFAQPASERDHPVIVHIVSQGEKLMAPAQRKVGAVFIVGNENWCSRINGAQAGRHLRQSGIM